MHTGWGDRKCTRPSPLIAVAHCDERPSSFSRTSTRMRSLAATRLQARFKFGNSLECLFSQGASFTSDVDLSKALDVWHATVKGGDELVQMTELARSIRLCGPFLSGHHAEVSHKWACAGTGSRRSHASGRAARPRADAPHGRRVQGEGLPAALGWRGPARTGRASVTWRR